MLDFEVVCRCYDKWNGRVLTIKRDIEMNINIRLFHIPSWWVIVLSQCLAFSNWTQRIRFLVNFVIFFEPPYLLDYNYIVVPLPIGFLWVHILLWKVCNNFSHLALGLRPKQGLAKVQAKIEAQESHFMFSGV